MPPYRRAQGYLLAGVMELVFAERETFPDITAGDCVYVNTFLSVIPLALYLVGNIVYWQNLQLHISGPHERVGSESAVKVVAVVAEQVFQACLFFADFREIENVAFLYRSLAPGLAYKAVGRWREVQVRYGVEAVGLARVDEVSYF